MNDHSALVSTWLLGSDYIHLRVVVGTSDDDPQCHDHAVDHHVHENAGVLLAALVSVLEVLVHSFVSSLQSQQRLPFLPLPQDRPWQLKLLLTWIRHRLSSSFLTWKFPKGKLLEDWC